MPTRVELCSEKVNFRLRKTCSQTAIPAPRFSEETIVRDACKLVES
jgi:hypothetical protein